MELVDKVRILADAAKYDASCSSSGGDRKRPKGGLGNSEGMGICHSYTPDGRCVSLLKILLTNYCIYDCLFCINRTSSGTPRARFSIEEVVNLTLNFYRRNYIEGLFLSSGIIQTPDYTMEQLVEVARQLREDHKFGGYIHLKTIPKASSELIKQAGLWADRLSINIELPTQSDLNVLAPVKEHVSIERSMGEIKERCKEYKEDKSLVKIKKRSFAPAGQSTQMIVGATQTSDALILQTSERLYKQHRLRRVYYSAFSPIPFSAPGVPLQATPLVREHRLYQADWLFRFYGFSHSELLPDLKSNLSLEMDPKMAWALANRHFFPVDLNKAPREMLLRVPGLGVRSVEKIIHARRFCILRLADIARLRIPFERVKYFIAVADSNPDSKLIDKLDLKSKIIKPVVTQLSLFPDESSSVVSGEL